MSPARFGLQALAVVTLGTIVSFPEQAKVSARGEASTAASAGRLGNPLAGDGRLSYPDGRHVRIGYGTISEYTAGADGAAAIRERLYASDLEGSRRPTPEGVLALGGKVNAIVGYARLRKAAIPFARVLVRNVSTGAVEARAIADEHGRFIFLDLLPSDYVIEVLDRTGAVVATSAVVGVGLNELHGSSFGSGAPVLVTFGNGLEPAAENTIETASRQGVSRVEAPERCASPPCSGSMP